jgi:hypothetical protein|tara:strand:- start:699 stop:956 length:258 start_codon:yes stop_codon:yes gene_type:complete
LDENVSAANIFHAQTGQYIRRCHEINLMFEIKTLGKAIAQYVANAKFVKRFDTRIIDETFRGGAVFFDNGAHLKRIDNIFFYESA